MGSHAGVIVICVYISSNAPRIPPARMGGRSLGGPLALWNPSGVPGRLSWVSWGSLNQGKLEWEMQHELERRVPRGCLGSPWGHWASLGGPWGWLGGSPGGSRGFWGGQGVLGRSGGSPEASWAWSKGPANMYGYLRAFKVSTRLPVGFYL